MPHFVGTRGSHRLLSEAPDVLTLRQYLIVHSSVGYVFTLRGRHYQSGFHQDLEHALGHGIT